MMLKSAYATALLLYLTGCAGPIQTSRVHASVSLSPDSFALTSTSDAGAIAPRQVARALEARGFSLAENPRYYVTVAMSVRPARIGAYGPDDAALPEKIDAPEASNGLFCARNAVQLAVFITDRGNGHSVSSVKRKIVCNYGYLGALPALADAAVADITR